MKKDLAKEATGKQGTINTEDKRPKLALAGHGSYMFSNSPDLYFGQNALGIQAIPEDYNKLIEMCRFFYKRDPVAGTVLNKISDAAITPLRNKRAQCTDEELAVYDSILDGLQEFFRNACLEYLLSGLLVPEYEWVRKSGKDISPKLAPQKRAIVPDNIWFRNPATIVIKMFPSVPNKRYFFVKLDTKFIKFIRAKGKPKTGIQDEKLYKMLKLSHPEFVKAIQTAKGIITEFPLSNARPILGRTLPEDPYPVPYMENALESLVHKRNLRKMDFSIAARVTASIQLIKLGSDIFPTEDATDFDFIKDQMNHATSMGESERIFQLFANHTLEISWIFPDTAAMLNQEKYNSVNDDIISAFGFPRSLITGESAKANTGGGSNLSTFSPIASMETIRDKFVEWTKVLYQEIRTKNRFKNMPIPRFERMKLYKLEELNLIANALYQAGAMSKASWLEAMGYDIETEVESKKSEKELFEKYGIDEAPPMAYDGRNGGQNPATQKQDQKVKGKPQDNNNKTKETK